MRAEDIVDQESFGTWLKEHEPARGLVVWIAARAAQRVLPLVEARPHAKKGDWLKLVRCLVISDIASLRDEDKRIKVVAEKAADETHRLASNAAYGAAASARSDIMVLGYASADYAAGLSAGAVIAEAGDFDLAVTTPGYAADAVKAIHRVEFQRTAFENERAHASPEYVEFGERALSDAEGAAGSGVASIWAEVARDCVDVELGKASNSIRLWRKGVSPFAEMWAQIVSTELGRAATKNGEAARGGARLDWTFWVDWYDDVLAGKPRNIPMMEEIALEVDWDKEPDLVLAQIEGIRAKYHDAGPQTISKNDTQLPEVRLETSVLVTALRANRNALPPTFDALEELIGLEIQRIQRDNWLNANNPEEAERLIKTFCTLFECVQMLRAKTVAIDELGDEDTEEIEGALTLYKKGVLALPREKVDEVVEGTYNVAKGGVQVGLIMGTSALFSYFGLPALGGAIAGSVGFGLKGAADIVKAARKDKGEAPD